jgi:hypothetical protein
MAYSLRNHPTISLPSLRRRPARGGARASGNPWEMAWRSRSRREFLLRG